MTLQIFGLSVQISKATESQKVTLETINMKVSEAIELIKQTRDQLIKAKGEILGKLAKLENLDVELTSEQSTIIADLRTTVQGVDDIIPDAPAHSPEMSPAKLPPSEISKENPPIEVPLSIGDEEIASEE